MESAEIRQRHPVTDTNELQKLSTKLPSEPRLKHGVPMQVLRSLLLATLVQQLLCSHLRDTGDRLAGYFINKYWYYSYMAYTKQ